MASLSLALALALATTCNRRMPFHARADGNLLVDAGITVSRLRMMEALASLGNDPIKHLDAKWERFVISPDLFRKMVYEGV